MKKLKKKSFNLATEERGGFTLIELSFAMAFIAVLLIAITVVATNIVAIYQKGLTLKAVNSVGRGLIDEFTAAINTAPSVDTTSLCSSLASGNVEACKNDHAFKYVFEQQRSPEVNGSSYQYNGIFCTGYYSYMWNTHYADPKYSPDGNSHYISLRYRLEGTNASDRSSQEESEPSLIRIIDRNYRLCSSVVDSNYASNYGSDQFVDIQTLAGSSPSAEHPLWNPIAAPETGFLKDFDLNLVLYDLNIFPISQDAVTLRTYMSGTFVLATTRGNIDLTRSGSACDLHDPEGAGSIMSAGSEYNYCAINKFNFAARTAGSGV